MSTTCARKGCRKKATYTVTLLTRNSPTPIQNWELCADDRDEVQAAVGRVLEKSVRITELVGMAKAMTQMTQAVLDKEDVALRDQIARSATSAEAAKHATVARPEEPESTPATPEAPVETAPGRRPVARPAN